MPRIRLTRQKKPTVNDQHLNLIESLRSLGMVTVTADAVAAAIKSLYPGGVNSTPQGELLKAIFLHLRAQGS